MMRVKGRRAVLDPSIPTDQTQSVLPTGLPDVATSPAASQPRFSEYVKAGEGAMAGRLESPGLSN